MPSTYSTNLALELMANGEDSGVWGQTTNTNLGTLLEQAIVGAATVAMADSDQTINMSNGISASARCFVITCTGANTAQRNLIVPTLTKPYIIFNNTTGGFGVQVKTSGGTGIVVPNGRRRFLYTDGVNVVEMLDSIANLTIGNVLTYGGVALSNSVTGTGSMVLSASPTLTGNPVASAGIRAIAPAGGSAVIINGRAADDFAWGPLAFKNDGVTNTGGISWSPAGATLNVGSGLTQVAAFTSTLFEIDVALKYGGVTLSNAVTGTGNMVLATAPTLTNPVVGTQSAADNSTKAASTAYVDAIGIQPGTILPYGASSAPTGYLLCSGAAFSRTTYSALFAIIGTSYGAGDGVTTFNVPDLRGRVLAGLDNIGGSSASRLTSATVSPNATTLGANGGEQTHILSTTEIPAHTHNAVQATSGAGSGGGSNIYVSSDGVTATATSSTGGGGAHNNVQPTILVNFIIKT